MLIQFTGLSGAGKTTLAYALKKLLESRGIPVVVIDGDEYRKTLCSDLGFSKADRCENIRRLGALAHSFDTGKTVVIIAAINPFEIVRKELKDKYAAATVWIKCSIHILAARDTKGLYKRAALPADDPQKILNLTGINDTYEIPIEPALVIDTGNETSDQSTQQLLKFVLDNNVG